jgi:hypothetical protein
MTQTRPIHEETYPLFNLRVLLRYDEQYAVHVAQCIETGNLVTADSKEDACEMMKELLEDEISFALKHKNIKNLMSSPAPLTVLVQWLEAARANKPTTIYLEVDSREVELTEIEPKDTGLRNRLEIAAAA